VLRPQARDLQQGGAGGVSARRPGKNIPITYAVNANGLLVNM
jgi:hypothetical protein